jgi:hypothetical protein
MQKHEIAARLAALEYVVTEVGCVEYSALGVDVESTRQVARARLGEWSVPGIKERYSDDRRPKRETRSTPA